MSSDPINEIFLKTGDFHFGGGRVRLRTLLGSCVAVTLWHPRAQLGGMCHYLLPHRGSASAVQHYRGGLYADEVIAMLVAEAIGVGTRPSDYVVKLFGGGNMFNQPLERRDCEPETCEPQDRGRCRVVPCRNILAAGELLAAAGFTIAGADTGGNRSRQLIMDLWSGDVWLRRGRSHIVEGEKLA
jgi:chemotaxis protein CheD